MASVKYASFESAIELPFYYSLASHKIDYDKLDDSPRRVLGQYAPWDGQRMQIQGKALEVDEYVYRPRFFPPSCARLCRPVCSFPPASASNSVGPRA